MWTEFIYLFIYSKLYGYNIITTFRFNNSKIWKTVAKLVLNNL